MSPRDSVHVLAAEVFDVPPSNPPSRAAASAAIAASRTGPGDARPRWFDFPWTAALVGFALAATLLHRFAPVLGDWLVADERFAAGEVWRLATGPFIHATWGHLIRDAALVALVGVAYEAPLARTTFGWFVTFALVMPTTAVLVATDASWYCGLSGVSHAFFAAAIVYELRHRRGGTRIAVFVLGLVFATKPIYELITGVPAFPMDLGPGVRQVPLAHLVGVAVGVIAGLGVTRESSLLQSRATISGSISRFTRTRFRTADMSRRNDESTPRGADDIGRE